MLAAAQSSIDTTTARGRLGCNYWSVMFSVKRPAPDKRMEHIYLLASTIDHQARRSHTRSKSAYQNVSLSTVGYWPRRAVCRGAKPSYRQVTSYLEPEYVVMWRSYGCMVSRLSCRYMHKVYMYILYKYRARNRFHVPSAHLHEAT